jgi:tRNA-specific 2-thiouridylase
VQPQAEKGTASAKQGCCTAADAADARRVADRLGIPFYALNFQAEFARIVDYFVAEYAAGRTPNPCIACNTWLKFGALFQYADSVGAQWVATGHYARIAEPFPALLRGRDDSKDQSYVLFGIDRRRLERLSLPVGEFHKKEIRRMAAELGLPVAEKRDSQEICFVPDQDHARLVREHTPLADRSGEIVTTDGRVVGRHGGLEQFTIGQRKGLGVALGERRFVVRIEPDTRRVVVGSRDELARGELTAARANWLIEPPAAPFRADVKIRYRSRAAEATVEPLPAGRFLVRFDEPCYGVAPGQAAVCYQGDRVLGGGWIE